jgi:Tfp pilus assembly protein PilP
MTILLGSTKPTVRFLLAASLAAGALVLAPAGAGAQQEGGAPPAQQESPAQQATPPVASSQELLTPQEREALDLVERLIREQEGVLMGTGFDYQSEGRRDPFRSLLAQIRDVSAPTVRPHGLPGFLISEVELKAIAAVQGRWHAMVLGPDQRAYFLEVGTELYDGHVMRIGSGEVLFEQVVPDITGARRTREVTKRLRTTDGGGETR